MANSCVVRYQELNPKCRSESGYPGRNLGWLETMSIAPGRNLHANCLDLDGTVYNQRDLRFGMAAKLDCRYWLAPRPAYEALRIVSAYRWSQELLRHAQNGKGEAQQPDLAGRQILLTCRLSGFPRQRAGSSGPPARPGASGVSGEHALYVRDRMDVDAETARRGGVRSAIVGVRPVSRTDPGAVLTALDFRGLEAALFS